MRRALMLVGPALMCCGPRDLFVESPTASGAASLLVAVEQTPPSIFAAPIDGPLSLTIEDAERVSLRAALLSESLEDLGLAPGPLTTSADDNARPLPANTTYFSAVLEDGAMTAWTDVTAPGAFESFRIPPSQSLGENCMFGMPREMEQSWFVSRDVARSTDGKVYLRTTEGTQRIDADGTITEITVTATTSLTIRVVDSTGMYFTDVFGDLWHGVPSGTTVEPRHVRVEPDLFIAELVPGHRPGEFVAATGDEVGPLRNGRFTPSFECDCDGLSSATIPGGRTFVGIGVNILEVVDDELLFQTIISGGIEGLHDAGDGGLIVLSRVGAGSGRISRFDPIAIELEELHLLDLEGTLRRSARTSRGVTYAATRQVDGQSQDALFHYVPGFGPCGAPIFDAGGLVRYIRPIDDGLLVFGGRSSRTLTWIP